MVGNLQRAFVPSVLCKEVDARLVLLYTGCRDLFSDSC